MTVLDRQRALKRKLLSFSIAALAVAAFGSVAITDALPNVQAAEGTPVGVSNPGSLIRSNVGVVTGANATANATYVVVGPNGVIYGPDGSIISTESPLVYTNGSVGGTPSSTGPQFTISTPTQVVAPLYSGTATVSGSQSPQRYYISGLDAPPVYTAPVVATPVGANIITGSSDVQATVDPLNNPNIIVGTPSGGANSSGVVTGNGRGIAKP